MIILTDLFNFTCLYLSYVSLYLCRKNYSIFLPLLKENLNYEIQKAAILGSTFESIYGFSKLIAGPFVDRFADYSKYILSISLFLAGLVNFFLFIWSSLGINIVLWGLNGFAQAFTWPAMSEIFMRIFKDNRYKGILYSILSTSQNLGSGSTPIILKELQKTEDWRIVVSFPGIVALCFSIFLLLFLYQPKNSLQKTKVVSSNLLGNLSDLLFNRNILLLSVGYIFCTFIRVAVSDWTFVYLQSQGINNLSVIVSLETGGFIGSLLIGFISDTLFQGKRNLVMSIFISFSGFIGFLIFSNVHIVSLDILYFSLGLFSFGPHVMVGLLAREIYTKRPNTAGTFSKFIAQIGGVCAGYPLSLVISSETLGWNYVAIMVLASGILSAICFYLIGSKKSKIT